MAKNRGGKEDVLDRHVGLLKMVQILSLLVVFMVGVILGLLSSSHINNYFSSQAKLFFSNNIASTTILEDLPYGKVNCENLTHPRTTNHRMSDEQLFWQASLVPSREGYPFQRVPKVAFMFLTRGPLPLRPLWERFFKGHEGFFSIYLHGPEGFVLNVSSDSVFYRREIPSQNVEWGDISLVDAERRLLGNALLDFSNERFVLLSESCIPVYNFRIVYKYLIQSDHSFVESYDDPSGNGRGRYNQQMFPEIHLEHWRKGSQWFEIHRAIAVYIVSDTKYYDLFNKYCKPACYPDEHYITTYLNMFHGPLNSNRTITWVDWSILGPHPATYTEFNTTERFIESIRKNATKCLYNSARTSVCYLFARKFDSSALQPLLNLASRLMKF